MHSPAQTLSTKRHDTLDDHLGLQYPHVYSRWHQTAKQAYYASTADSTVMLAVFRCHTPVLIAIEGYLSLAQIVDLVLLHYTRPQPEVSLAC